MCELRIYPTRPLSPHAGAFTASAPYPFPAAVGLGGTEERTYATTIARPTVAVGVVGRASPSAPLVDMERRARRLAWLAPGVLAALLGTFVVIMTILQPPAPDQLVSYALNLGSLFVLLLVFGLLLQHFVGRGIRRFAPLEPRVREADMPLRGPSLMLDNGLLVCFFQSGAFLTMFFAADGTALHPRLHDALLWTRPRRLKYVKMVRSRTGPPEPRGDLDAMVTQLLVGSAVATVHQGKAPTDGPGGPRWVVTLNMFRLFGGPKIDRLASRLDEVEVFMKGFLRPALAGATPQAFPWWRVAIGIAAMAGLAILLVAALLWPESALVLLTAGMVFIVVVAAYGTYSMRVRAS